MARQGISFSCSTSCPTLAIKGVLMNVGEITKQASSILDLAEEGCVELSRALGNTFKQIMNESS